MNWLGFRQGSQACKYKCELSNEKICEQEMINLVKRNTCTCLYGTFACTVVCSLRNRNKNSDNLMHTLEN